jgi:cell division protein FtsI (penicillin-binding protein 3)
MPESANRSIAARVTTVMGVITLWSVVIAGRLGELQVLRHEEYAAEALQRQQITRSMTAPRGVIYDSHMDELATSITVSTVVAEPRLIKDLKGTSKKLASILGLNAGELHSRLSDPDRRMFAVIKRRIDPKSEARIESLRVEGINLLEESMRVYPNRELASHILGFVNMNGDGGAGLELLYDRELKGLQGQVSFNVDARRRSFRGTVVRAPVQGHSLVVSLDRSIQYIVERELAAGVERTGAASASAIVMESDTGRILALGNYPDFNCNSYNEYSADRWLNRAISVLFEPGSTFKVVVATAALEAGLTRPDEIIDCQMGKITIARHVFHDHKPYGLLTFREVLEHSSNIGAAKLGLRLGEQQLYEALRNFGFGSKTEIDLPAEIVGLVRHWSDWSGLSIGAISFGQEVGVTSLQILTAINAIANGGYRTRPSVVDRVIDEQGDLVRVRAPERTRIMSPETAATVRDAFEGVVVRGTGRKAALEGYRAAGKTGTAQKIVNGQYSNTKYVASFIGFAPLPNPRISVLVQIDEPRVSIYGGEVAAPIFSRIVQETLLQLRVPPDQPTSVPQPEKAQTLVSLEDFLPNATPVRPGPASKSEQEQSDTVRVWVGNTNVVLPDFRGLPKRKVVSLCLELGIRLQAAGSGFAVFQAPPPGSTISVGDTCAVTFARVHAAARRNLSVPPPNQDAGPVAQAAAVRP